MNICVVGTGYVGLVSGACLAQIGHCVVCVDSDENKISKLKKGEIPIYEQGLKEIVRKNCAKKRLFFARSISEGMGYGGRRAQAVLIAVGTPPRPNGSADLSQIERVAREIAQNLTGYCAIVQKSTVPVGTGDMVKKIVNEFKPDAARFDIVSNPEFLREGVAVEDFLHPERVVAGVSSKRAASVMRKIYAPLKAPVFITDIKSAEIIKQASNSFLATKISFINSVANLCEKAGANVEHVARGMGMDKRIGPSFLKAGLGFGGFCLPKDVDAFYQASLDHGYDFELLKTINKVNESQKMWVVRNARQELGGLKGKTIAVLGLAFKPETDDMRYSPSIDIINGLIKLGAKIKAYDPVAMSNAKKIFKKVKFCADPYDCLKNADCMALVTEWPEFAKLNFRKIFSLLRRRIILDGRNLYSPQKLRAMGFNYRSVGRP
ncbi:MAG: UDP-glucose/GDP-mannose dehydrogenase family protein [Elusimicrobia bacterium]|nr:UDP-glucose/GDP-mannose dehydrogenase family protein [Elusimicrobiota bacterium]